MIFSWFFHFVSSPGGRNNSPPKKDWTNKTRSRKLYDDPNESKWIQMNRRIWSTLPIRIQTHLGQKTSSQLGLGPFVVDRCPGVSCLALPYLLDRKIRCIIASRMMDKSLGICKLHELTKNKVWVNKKLIIWHKPELWVSGYHYHHFLWIWPALHGCA